jgi:hypothetical protein
MSENKYGCTNYMEQSPSWEADSSTASQEIPCLVWKSYAHYHVQKCLPLDPIQSNMNPVHALFI